MSKVRVTAEKLIKMQEELNSFEAKSREEFMLAAESLERIEDYLICRESTKIKMQTVKLKGEAKKGFENLRIHIGKLSDIAVEYNEAESMNVDLIENKLNGG